MSTPNLTECDKEHPVGVAMKRRVVVIPVADVDRAKPFYEWAPMARRRGGRGQ